MSSVTSAVSAVEVTKVNVNLVVGQPQGTDAETISKSMVNIVVNTDFTVNQSSLSKVNLYPIIAPNRGGLAVSKTNVYPIISPAVSVPPELDIDKPGRRVICHVGD